MSPIEKRTLCRLLVEFCEEDFGGMPNYGRGGWSARNLDALIEDIEKWMPDADTALAAMAKSK